MFVPPFPTIGKEQDEGLPTKDALPLRGKSGSDLKVPTVLLDAINLTTL